MTDRKYNIKLRVVEIFELSVAAENKENAEGFALQEYEDGNLLSRKEFPEKTISIDSCNQDN